MKYKIEITERMKAVIEVNARSATEALAKAERKYYDDKVYSILSSVEFAVVLGNDKTVRARTENDTERT